MSIKSALLISISCVFGGAIVAPTSREKMYQWVIEMHRAQIELLKIDWGKPGITQQLK